MRDSSSKRIYLSSPTMHGEEQEFVKEAFDRNWVAPLGFNCDGFEKEMEEKLNASADHPVHAFATVSGTGAIHLAVRLAGIGPGDKVLCSDMTFSATVNPVTYEGAEQVFIDSETDTWNMDPAALEKAFQKYPGAKVVVMAHLYGTPGKMDEILGICRKHGAVLIEDAAEAADAYYRGKACGTFGKYGALSFNGNKIITTSGGGMLLTGTAEERAHALKMATQARESAPWYQHEELGFNYRMSNIVAGIGRGQLRHIDEHRARKESIYRRYREAFRDLPVSMNPWLEDTQPNFWLSCLLIDEEAMCECSRSDRETSWVHEEGRTCPDEIASLLAAQNIESRPIWKPLHLQPFFRNCDFVSAASSPVNEDIFRRGICLPSDIKMTEEEQNAVIETVRGAFGK